MKKKIIAFLIFLFVALILILYLVGQVHTYTDYTTLSSAERTDDESVKLASFKGEVLKYGSDGISLTDLSNNILWSQSFEINSIQLAISDDYVAVAETGGTQIYLFDVNGFVGKFDSERQIVCIDVSDIGTVAVIEGEDGICYLNLFDSSGNELAEGTIHIDNNGFPVSVALSPNGNLMAVAFMGFTSGEVKSHISFYNFGKVGQNEIDNIVATYDYDSVIANVKYVNDTTCIAFGDNTVQIYRGSQKPALGKEISVEREISSIYCGNGRFGLVYRNDKDTYEAADASADAKTSGVYTTEVYNYNGRRLFSTDFDLSYDRIEVLDNKEICIIGGNSVQILSKWGKVRFRYTFDDRVMELFSSSSMHTYEIMFSDRTEHIRLK